METVRRRPEKESQSRDGLNEKSSMHPLKVNHEEYRSNHRDSLLIGVAIPFVILLIFGGKLSLFILSFGGLLCYIFDLIGSIEGTLISVVITLLALMCGLIWTARLFLLQAAANFSLVIIMGIVLFYTFVIMVDQFISIERNHFTFLLALDQILLATLPLVASVVITWFTCIEVPALDLAPTFSLVYFIYALILCKPRPLIKRKKKSSNSLTQLGNTSESFLIPPGVMFLVYLLPGMISVLIHASVHHNVLSTERTRLLGLAVSILLPNTLMLYCARQQVGYWEESKRKSIRTNLERFFFFHLTFLFLCLQDLPLFDELKSFSGLSEPIPTFLLIGAASLVFIAIGLHVWVSSSIQSTFDEDMFSIGNMRKKTNHTIQLLRSMVTLAIGLASGLLSIIATIPSRIIPISVVGSMTLAELYHNPEWSVLSQVLLVAVTTLSMMMSAVAFTHNTVFFLLFGFSWHFDLTMQQFCSIFSLLLGTAVTLPALVHISHAKAMVASDILPNFQSGGNGVKAIDRNLGIRLFEFLFSCMVAIFATIELLVREQEWSSLQVGVETIYPSSYLIGSAFIIALTAAALNYQQIIGPANLWIIMTIQGCKLLHLVGVHSLGVATCVSLVLAYTLPFIRQIHQYFIQNEQESFVTPTTRNTPTPQNSMSIHWAELVSYVMIAAAATYWLWVHVIHNLMATVLTKDPSDTQQAAACLALWSGYCSCILLVFFKQAKFLRSACVTLCAIFSLFAFEAFGELTLTMDPESSLFMAFSLHPNMTTSEHSTLFLIISSVLTLMVWIGVLSLTSLPAIVLYAGMFGYLSTKAVIGWSFPLSLAEDSLTHEVLAFPFCYVYLTKYLVTFVALWNPPTQAPLAFLSNVGFFILCILPFVAMGWSFYADVYHQSITGIVWTTIVGNTSLCVSTRMREVAWDLRQFRLRGGAYATAASAAIAPNRAAKARKQLPVCLIMALLTILWTIRGTMRARHWDRDIVVPLSTLLLLCTKEGDMFPDTPPLVLSAVFSSLWWVLSALYSMFIVGMYTESDLPFDLSSDFFGLDADISFWTNESKMICWLNLAQLIVPIPGIILGLMRRKDESEDVLFVLAVVSAVPIIGASVSSVRYLGMIAMLLSAWRCYDVGQMKKRSNRII